MTTDQWHRLIDAVAHDMTAGAPDAGFRARLLERVAEPGSAMQPAGLAWVWRGAAVAAVLGVVVIVVSILRPSRVAPPATKIARDIGARPAAVAVTGPATGPAETRPAAASRAERAPQTPLALVEWQARTIAALNGVSPLVVDHIQPAGLAISQLTVAPLGIAALVIPAIDDQR